MNETVLFMTLGGSAIVHFVITCVMGLFARHRVQYLCLAWVNGIFFATLLVSSFFSHAISHGEPGILHPAMLLAVLCACYLQSIYPLNISMPGFLQWERMWRYARPILVLIGIYIGAALMGSRIVYIYSAKDLVENILSSDILMRLCALGMSIYYIVNIFLLPRRMARHANVPRYLLGYCIAMGLSVVFYTYVAIYFDQRLLAIYVVLFTVLNLYLMFRTLETLALQLPRPVIEEVSEEPSEESKEKEQEDFNEANLHRFQRINFWMQNHREEWKDSTFGRDRLCQEVGLNRHLVLQSVCSQGFNNVHDYISSFRVAELKRMISRGEVKALNDTLAAGFGTTQTVRACFLKAEGITLDEYLGSLGIPRKA
ncbi:MAG: hypothetical protein IJT48_07375 [Bacteroidaceae bacterium]|nr:hypothetical protein [Bacteroidaceae bacterium]